MTAKSIKFNILSRWHLVISSVKRDKTLIEKQFSLLLSNTMYIALSCNCKKYYTQRCRYVKNSKPCLQYCHKIEFNYDNLPDTVLKLPETQLVPRAEFEGSVKVSLLTYLWVHKLTFVVLQDSETKACYNYILYQETSVGKGILKKSAIVGDASNYKSKSKGWGWSYRFGRRRRESNDVVSI